MKENKGNKDSRFLNTSKVLDKRSQKARESGIREARKVLTQGDEAIAAYLLNLPLATVSRVSERSKVGNP